MKKFNFLLLVMCFISITSLGAVTGVFDQNPDGDLYPAKARTNFSIKAYKKTPDPVIMTVYDAFSRNLDEVIQDSEIDVYPKMAYFLADDFSALRDPHERVIFSFVISGQSTGQFNLSITITPFNGPCTFKDNVWQKGNDIIDSHFDFVDYKVKFQNGKPDYGEYSITDKSGSLSNVNIATKGQSANLKASWSVDYTGQSTSPETAAINQYWHAEGSVAMAIKDKLVHGYNHVDTKAGRYQSIVKIELTIV